MSDSRRRIIEVTHRSAGRLRLRLRWLRGASQEAPPLADHLASLNGMIEAAVRPWTGSVLCHYDPERLDADRIVAAVQRHTGTTAVVRPGEPHPPPVHPSAQSGAPAGSLARAIVQSFTAINQEVLEGTEGRLDLGILASLGFAAAGATEIAVTRQIPAPPWFNLAWWAIRTFTTFERDGAAPPVGTATLSAPERHAGRTVARPRPSKRHQRSRARRP